MRERRLASMVMVCNIVVLSLGVAAWATEVSGAPDDDVLADGDEAGPSAPEMPTPLSWAGEADLPPADPSARIVELPTHELEHLPGTPRQGTLAGDAGLDGGCLWIEMAEESQAVRWPAGLQAGFVTDGDSAGLIELIDASGRVLARVGETVYFTGARSGGSERLERCHVGADTVWYVGAVTSQSPFE